MNILLQRATTPHVQFQSGIDILVATSVTLMMMMMTYRTVLRRTPASLYHGTVLLVLVVVKSNDIIMRHWQDSVIKHSPYQTRTIHVWEGWWSFSCIVDVKDLGKGSKRISLELLRVWVLSAVDGTLFRSSLLHVYVWEREQVLLIPPPCIDATWCAFLINKSHHHSNKMNHSTRTWKLKMKAHHSDELTQTPSIFFPHFIPKIELEVLVFIRFLAK